MDVDTTIQKLQASNTLDDVYTTSVILKWELSLAEMHVAVGNNYGKLQFALSNFQKMLKEVVNNKKCLLDPNDKLLL